MCSPEKMCEVCAAAWKTYSDASPIPLRATPEEWWNYRPNECALLAPALSNEWVSVLEHLPTNPGVVSIREADGIEKEAWFVHRKQVFVSPDGAIGYNPTHWRLNWRAA